MGWVCVGKGCVYKRGVLKRDCVGKPRCVCVCNRCVWGGQGGVRERCVCEGEVCV